MKSKTTRNTTAALTVVAGLAAAWLIPTQASADEANRLICDGSQTYTSRRLDSVQTDNLCEVHKGKVLLVVNTASRCGFTGQYDGLEKLYADYQDRGLVVVGFPSNDFANQEPGNEKSIKKFCRLTYGVRFPMYAKTRVTGDDADPIYKALARAAGHSPAWNFHKYLIDREGRLAGSYSSMVKPRSDRLVQAIEQLL